MATHFTGVYEVSMTIPRFRGINQQDGANNINPEYAAYAENCDTRGGVLRPARAPLEILSPLPAPIGTLACFHRRYHMPPEEKDVLVAVAGGALYVRTMVDQDWTEVKGGFLSDDWDYLTYEISREGDEAPVDVLLMSNALDGMICLFGDDFRIEPIPTPKKFGVIGRHAERVWGTAIPDDPDMLVYSAPFDPFDWTQNDAIPEDGAGDVLQPTWDGDRFIALKNWGEYLLAFKRNSVWLIMGTDPGQYTMKQQYGEDGSATENTIASERSMVLMLYEGGISYYNGTEVMPLHRDTMRGIFDRMHQSNTKTATATVWDHKYLLAVPLDGSPTNNAIIEYDTLANTWMLRTGIEVAAFCRFGDERLLCTNPTAPGRVYAMNEGEAQEARWEMPYQDQGGKNAWKSGFKIYLTIEAKNDVSVRVDVETERKVKSKVYQVAKGARKMKRVQIGNRGRRWRLVFSAPAGAMWEMLGGVQVDMDTDAD